MSHPNINVTPGPFNKGEADDYLMVLARPPMSEYAARIVGQWLKELPGVGMVFNPASGIVATRKANRLFSTPALQGNMEIVVNAFYDNPELHEETEETAQLVDRILQSYYHGQPPRDPFVAERLDDLEKYQSELRVGTNYKFDHTEREMLTRQLASNTQAWGVEFGPSGHNLRASVPTAFVSKDEVAGQFSEILHRYVTAG